VARAFGARAFLVSTGVVVLAALAFGWTSAAANVTATPAAGGTGLIVGQFAALSGPVIAEAAAGEIGTGTIMLRLPSGFEFDTTPNAVTARVSDGGRCRGNDRPLARHRTGGASRRGHGTHSAPW
jgi:hypothetical protein